MTPLAQRRSAHLTNHPLLEDVVFSCLSFLVVAVALLAVFGPKAPTLAVAAAPEVPPANRVFIAVYGTLVDDTNSPIVGATVAVKDAAGTVMLQTTTGALGTWGGRFKGEAGSYTLEITIVKDGAPLTASAELELSPDFTWGIQAVFAEPSSSMVFVPIPGY